MAHKIVQNMTGVDETETITGIMQQKKKASLNGALHSDKCSCNKCK